MTVETGERLDALLLRKILVMLNTAAKPDINIHKIKIFLFF